jgi:stringent starvation protein B
MRHYILIAYFPASITHISNRRIAEYIKDNKATLRYLNLPKYFRYRRGENLGISGDNVRIGSRFGGISAHIQFGASGIGSLLF